MAYASTEILAQKKSIWASVANGFSVFFTALIKANSRSAEIERFQKMSDRQLADIGLQRDDIVRHVFADKMGL
ncbi:DUF1127 domain-containing protein [Falsihalocynthiibacter arcticus]|uniref:YjiS-like domain-containing protein n=1 Tax=Falsihalocynthiibacter arcticus TaxID=1579316 RepID=A0A126V638_9RHOB|nr:DUF1127 domain-containing protein [Falsihalocynthiibacter arcticus]AML53169.1 hypothetical protein RC74_19635 [Falsihalocynthiibacter arcticus]